MCTRWFQLGQGLYPLGEMFNNKVHIPVSFMHMKVCVMRTKAKTESLAGYGLNML